MSFRIYHRCGGCGKKQEFENSKRFRVNANGNLVDVWLIYRCKKCKHSWNLTIYERTRPHRIPAELFDARINKTSQGIHDRWKGYEGPHFDIIRKWAVADGCWIDHPKPSPLFSEMLRKKKELIDQFGRDKYDRTIAKLGIDDPHEVKKHLENLGFVPGAEITAVTQTGGNWIVNIKESRVAVSEEMAKKIFV